MNAPMPLLKLPNSKLSRHASSRRRLVTKANNRKILSKLHVRPLKKMTHRPNRHGKMQSANSSNRHKRMLSNKQRSNSTKHARIKSSELTSYLRPWKTLRKHSIRLGNKKMQRQLRQRAKPQIS